MAVNNFLLLLMNCLCLVTEINPLIKLKYVKYLNNSSSIFIISSCPGCFACAGHYGPEGLIKSLLTINLDIFLISIKLLRQSLFKL
jgi:hypothetical protein